MQNRPSKSRKENKSPYESNPCTLCRVMQVAVCKGHAGSGGGSGGGGGGGGGGEEKKSATPGGIQLPVITDGAGDAKVANPFTQLLQLGAPFKFETGLISVECNPKQGTFSVEAQPGLSNTDLAMVREFLNELKNSFNRFKAEIKNEIFTGETKYNGYGVSFTFRDPNQLNGFLTHLAKENLLPTPTQNKQEKKRKFDTQETVGTKYMSTKSAKHKDDGQEVKSQNRFHPNPTSTKLKKKSTPFS